MLSIMGYRRSGRQPAGFISQPWIGVPSKLFNLISSGETQPDLSDETLCDVNRINGARADGTIGIVANQTSGTLPLLALTLSNATHPAEVWLATIPIVPPALATFIRLTSHNVSSL